MKEIKSIDELLGLVDVGNSKEDIEKCLHYVDTNPIEFISIDAVIDSDNTAIIGKTPSHSRLLDGPWYDYSIWYSLYLTESVSMQGTHLLDDEGKMVEFFDKLRMLVL